MYKTNAIKCVGDETLMEYFEQFHACNDDLDLLFSTKCSDEVIYRKVIEPNHIYEAGYPRCICWKNDNDPNRCECSRCAIEYLYSRLVPDKKLTVSIIHTVLNGANNCRFRIIVE